MLGFVASPQPTVDLMRKNGMNGDALPARKYKRRDVFLHGESCGTQIAPVGGTG